MQLTERHNEYWRKNLEIHGNPAGGVVPGHVREAWFARELNTITFFGWPLGFWFSAQGSLAIYVAIIGIYAVLMKKLDREYNVDEGDLE